MIHIIPPCRKRFIEQELARRLGRQVPEDEAGGQRGRLQKSIEDVAMEAAAPKQKAFDADPGAAFVAGVAEVPLDVAHRLKNIEATEAAKAALLRKGHAPGLYDDDEDGEGASGGLRRGQFPVRFGRQSAKEAALLQEVAAKKAQARERAAEKKRLKAKEFAGW